MSKRINKELQQAIDKLNEAIKEAKRGEYAPLVFNTTIKKEVNGKR